MRPEKLKEYCQEEEKKDPSPGYKIGSPTNVWGIGIIMWELLTLRPRVRLFDRIRKLTEEAYWGKNQQETIAEIKTLRDPEYSHKLRELIRQCLRIAPERRPTHNDLYLETSRFLKSRVRRANDKEPGSGRKDGPRVFYMGHEINDMPINWEGVPDRAPINYQEADFAFARGLRFSDPELESLLNGRWDSVLQYPSSNVPPPVYGGRKRTRKSEAYIFMPDRDNPRRLTKKVRLVEDIGDSVGDYDSGSSDGTPGGNAAVEGASETTSDRTPGGDRRGAGKTRGGNEGGIGGKWIGRGGIAQGGKGGGKGINPEEGEGDSGGDSTHHHGDENNRDNEHSQSHSQVRKDSLELAKERSGKGKGKGKGRRKSVPDGFEDTSPNLQAKALRALAELDRQQATRSHNLESPNSNESSPSKHSSAIQPPLAGPLHGPQNEPEGGRPPSDSPSRLPTLPPPPPPPRQREEESRGKRANAARGRGRSSGRGRGSQRGRGRGGTGRGRGDGTRGRGRGRGRGDAANPPPRRTNRNIIQQDLSALQTRDVGGRR
jgi:hypothetical protein